MAASRWTFTKEQLANTPSRKMGIDADKELSYRQQAANLIQDMGQRLSVTQLCINTAIVYMHRFYMLRPFTKFPRNEMAPACLFLSCKVEEQPRKLEHVIKVAHSCLYRDNRPAPDPKTEAYLEQAQQLVINENILLQTLGFEVRVEHPHTFIVKATALVKASKDLSQSSYYLATNSLHMTTFCLQYRPTVVACVCMYLACKWAKYMIPKSNEGKEWFYYVDPSVTKELIEDLYSEFLNILDTCPTKLKKKIMGWKGTESQQRDMPNQDPTFETVANHMATPSQHRHERRESSHHSGESSRVPAEHRSNQEHSLAYKRDVRPDQARDVPVDRRKDAHAHPDRRPHPAPGAHPSDHKGPRRDETRGSHSNTQKKESLPPTADHRERHFQDSFKKEDAPVVKREHDVNGRSSTPQPPRTQQEAMVTEQSVETPLVKLEPGTTATSGASDSQSSATSVGAEMPRKTKSETAINFKEYMKRKEKEKREKEQTERLRIQLEKEKEKRAKEAENLNKTYSEGMSNREQKPRPPKLDVSLPLPVNLEEFSAKDVSERPYEVNIKSPIKPHKNITVKSPIKSSDLKHPKLELPKVQLTPEPDGSDPFSVNINSDPAIRKLIGKEASVVHSNGSDSIKFETMTRIKQEPGISISPRLSPRVKPELPHSGAIKMEPMPVSELKVKQERIDVEVKQEPRTIHTDPLTLKIKKELSDKTSLSSTKVSTQVKDDLEPGELDDSEPEINLLPEHVSAPAIKIRELGYDPDVGLESAHALKHAMEREALGGRGTPGLGQSRVDGGTEANMPIKMKIPRTHSQPSQPESPSLKIKISTKGISTDSDHSSGKHSSPHRHKHKHKDKHKHKSHKHSRDKERHRDHDKPREGQAASTSVGTNGQSQSIKLSIKLGDLQSRASPSATEVPGKQKLDKQKHRSSISDPALNRNAVVEEIDKTQPWSMSDLVKPVLPAAVAESPSRKRRRMSGKVEPNTDVSQHKAAKMGPPRLRRSSSSHSVVSMEMSDEESCQTNGQIQTEHEPMINKLKDNLQQLIAQKQIEYIKNKQAHESRNSPMQALKKPIDRQQSGFDLDGMMWAGNSGDHPPLPSDHPAPPPLPPQQVARQPPR